MVKMFAVIRTGGKQYKVKPGQILEIEKLEVDSGKNTEFNEVLSLGNGGEIKFGSPSLDNVVVRGNILEQKRGDKIIVFKKKRRQGYDRKTGHRQYLTVVKIEDILENGKSVIVKDQLTSDIATENKELKNKSVKTEKKVIVKTDATKSIKAVESSTPKKKLVDNETNKTSVKK